VEGYSAEIGFLLFGKGLGGGMHVVRKLSVVFVIGLLAFTTACSSSSSSTSADASGTGTATAVAAGTCPTSNTVKFAKTKFVADAALAGGAFKRYIYTPAKDGKLKKGASGRVLALIKAAAAGAFVINRLKAAETAAQANPTLCKIFVAPAQKFTAALTGLVGKAKSGGLDPSDVDGASSALTDLHNAATSGGSGFADNANANISG
jgi:hypothetical protein